MGRAPQLIPDRFDSTLRTSPSKKDAPGVHRFESINVLGCPSCDPSQCRADGGPRVRAVCFAKTRPALMVMLWYYILGDISARCDVGVWVG